MYIPYDCCHDCKPPKRKPACHDTCPDYKAVHDANMAIKEKKKCNEKSTAILLKVASSETKNGERIINDERIANNY